LDTILLNSNLKLKEMKKLILLLAILVASISSFAQTNYNSTSVTYKNDVLNTTNTIKNTNASYGTFHVDNYLAPNNVTYVRDDTPYRNYGYKTLVTSPVIHQQEPNVLCKIFEDESGTASEIVNDAIYMEFRSEPRYENMLILTFRANGELEDSRTWDINSVDRSSDRWTVIRCSNDKETFDLILFDNSDGENLVIIDYLNGSHTELSGSIDY